MSDTFIRKLVSKGTDHSVPGPGAGNYTGKLGEIWYDPYLNTLHAYNGDPGGMTIGGDSFNLTQFWDYGYAYGSDCNINLTKKYHWLVDLGDGHHYNLLDGVDGQELIFLPCNGLDYQGHEESDVYVNSMKYWDDGDARWWTGSRITRIFGHADASNMKAQVSALWMNGSWHFSAGPVDLGNVP